MRLKGMQNLIGGHVIKVIGHLSYLKDFRKLKR